MPLLRRQPFVKQKPPPGVKDDDLVFVCKTTGEMFSDYEKFFERTILCNSLVWTCELTGKSGLTFQEALDSEEKASKQLATIPESLQKPILYLTTLTHRTRLSDLNDDIYSYVKEHYFIGEVVEVVQHGEKKKCRVIKVISPNSGKKNGTTESIASTSDDDSVICLDDPPKPSSSKESPKEESLVNADSFEYVVQEVKKTNIYIIKADSISRKWGSYTRDKSKMFLKQHCALSSSGKWNAKEKYLKKFKIADVSFTDIYDGPQPVFQVSQTKRKPYGSASSSYIDLTDEDKAIKRAKKDLKERKKREKEERKQMKENIKKKLKAEKQKQKKKKVSPVPPPVVEVIDEANFEELRKLSLEEKAVLKEQIKAEKLAARLVQLEERKKLKEEDKKKKKEEKDKEREKQKEEKMQRDAYLKEWSKPRDDLECDDLKDLPRATPIQTHIPSEIFGNAVMLLEYLHCFETLLDLNSQFPNGISIDELGEALVSTEVDGMMYDLMKLLLTTLFQLQVDEDEADEDEEDASVAVTDLPLTEEDTSFKELVKKASIAAQWPQLYYSTALRDLPIDSFTITEVLRLHFLSSGAKASESSARFRYQQRGGYTSHDDAGLEFTREEVALLRELASKNVFDLGPGEKLKVLTAMVHQILTFAASRDIMEDNAEQLKQVSYDLRHHRWAEQRREKEEVAFCYKKRLEERAKEKELERQRKEEKKRLKVEKLAQEEGGAAVVDASKSEESIATPKESPISDPGERHSNRMKEKHDAKNDAEFFEMPAETIQWDKLAPEDRVRLKEKYVEKEMKLMDEVNKLQHAMSITPIGRDRTFRRYWIFQSLPGLFIEDDDEYVPNEMYEEFAETNEILRSNGQLVKSEDATVVVEEKSPSSDKENDSFDHNKSSRPPTPVRSTLVNEKNIKILSENDTNTTEEELDSNKTLDNTTDNKVCVYDQISQRNMVKWSYYRVDQLDSLLNSLNTRGYREGALKAVILEQKNYLEKIMENLPLDQISMTKLDTEKDKKVKYQNVKSKKKVTQGAVKNASAQEYLELNLREMLLDIEERIYVGSLGAMKIKKREKWRNALEQGTYDAQCDEDISNSFNRSSVKENGEVDSDDEEDGSTNLVVRDLAKALLQIERGIDKKYLTTPLGEEETKKQKQKSTSKSKSNKNAKKKDEESASDNEDDDEEKSDKGPQKTSLEMWETSLMTSTSFSQVILHLSVLETSITWSKSALHARCRICRRKGDAEKMLLCDGCDRGHHMYCLKPPVKAIPRGDWYCPDCKPKDIPKTPRKRRKSVFEEEEEEENTDSSTEEEDSSDEDDSDDNTSSDDSDESTEEEDTEEELEEEPKITKIKFINAKKKKAQPVSDSKAKHSTNQAASQEKGARSSNSTTSNTSVNSKKKLDLSTTKKNDAETKSKRSRRSLPEPTRAATSSVSRRSLDSAKSGVKRKREDEVEELPEPKKGVVSKSRGGERDRVSKLCEELLFEIIERKESWPFMMAVSRRDAPDYFDIVKKPMDLSTIKNKINRYEYTRPSDILDDIRLTFKNCEQYNVPTAAEYIAGQKLSRYFEKRVKELQLNTLLEKTKSPKKGSSPSKVSPGSKRSTRQR